MLSMKGRNVAIPSAEIQGRTIITRGKWLKIAVPQDEELIEGETVPDPESFVSEVKRSRLSADIFTFAQKLADRNPKFNYHLEWDNFAAIPITTFSDWWDKRAESSVRRAVRKAAKTGVVVKVVEFDDTFVQGIVNINNESPVRQGKAFWHFQKSFEAVKAEHLTYPTRTEFLGAYFEGELIGYIRITYADHVANIIQVISMMKHFDKRPTNALIAKAVEISEQRGAPFLTYCNFVYNDPDSSLTEFKRRSGFEQVLVPRYYIPLTLKGGIALRMGLHQGLVKLLPKPVIKQFLKIRGSWYASKAKTPEKSVSD